MSKRRVNYIGLIVLALGLSSTIVGLAIRRRHIQQHQQVGGTVTTKPYIMVQKQTFFSGEAGDTGILNAVKVRFQRSNGDWKCVTTYYNRDGTVKTVNKEYAVTGMGIFEINEKDKTLEFLSPKSHVAHIEREDELKKDPEFRREEIVLGFKAIVLNLAGTDVSYAPALDGAVVKIVDLSGGSGTVIEPVTIDIAEPPASEFADIPEYTFDYRFFEGQIALEQKRGNKEVASRLRQRLEEHKALYGKAGKTAQKAAQN